MIFTASRDLAVIDYGRAPLEWQLHPKSGIRDQIDISTFDPVHRMDAFLPPSQ
jgi:hypothetical protein